MSRGTPVTPFRLTDEDKQILKLVANKRGLNATELLRRLIREESVRLAVKQ